MHADIVSEGVGLRDDVIPSLISANVVFAGGRQRKWKRRGRKDKPK